jgi:hypothetical protein
MCKYVSSRSNLWVFRQSSLSHALMLHPVGGLTSEVHWLVSRASTSWRVPHRRQAFKRYDVCLSTCLSGHLSTSTWEQDPPSCSC